MTDAPTTAPVRPHDDTTPLFMSAKEAARLLSVSRSRVYRLMDDGELPSTRIGHRRVIPAGAVHEFAAAVTAVTS